MRPVNPVSTVRPSAPTMVNRITVRWDNRKLLSTNGAASSAIIRTAVQAFTAGESVRTINSP
jgi:hypothetical protein